MEHAHLSAPELSCPATLGKGFFVCDKAPGHGKRHRARSTIDGKDVTLFWNDENPACDQSNEQ